MICDVCSNPAKPTVLANGEIVTFCKSCLQEDHSLCESCDEWFDAQFDEYCLECVAVHVKEAIAV